MKNIDLLVMLRVELIGQRVVDIRRDCRIGLVKRYRVLSRSLMIEGKIVVVSCPEMWFYLTKGGGIHCRQ